MLLDIYEPRVEFTHVEIILEMRGKVKENFLLGTKWGRLFKLGLYGALSGKFAVVLAPFLDCKFPKVTRVDESDRAKATIV